MKFLVFLSLVLHSVLSDEIGADCLVPPVKSSPSREGKCVKLKECSEALSELRNGKLPYICGYRGLEALVCCPSMPEIENRVEKLQVKPDNPNRISRQKCAEYGKSVFKMVPQFTMEGQRLVNVSNCASNAHPLREESIYAKQREFPHMALVGVGPKNNKRWVCSGSLISEKFVLTVAHCTISRFSGEVEWVRLGDLDFDSPNDNSIFFDFSVVEITRHPQYRAPVLYNDIALLELDRPVSFSEYIRPACLHGGSDDTHFVIAGWALMEEDNRGHLRQYKRLKMVENQQCAEDYKSLVGRKLMDGIVEEKMICTEEAKNDACRISSGACLQTFNNDVYCMYDIVGISSFGRGVCSSQPVVYTRVSAYLHWIESIVWPQVIQM